MKLCPYCGAELDDKAIKCSICDAKLPEDSSYVEPTAVSRPPIAVDLTARLAEMRAKIEQLSSPPRQESPPPKVETSIESQIVSEAEETKPSPVAEEPVEIEKAEEPTDEEVEYEEIVIETRHIGQGAINGLGIPGLGKKVEKKPEGTGRKIKADEISAPKKKQKGIGLPQIAATVLIIAIVIIASWYLLLNKPSNPVPAIDGILDEWNSIEKYPALIESDDPNLNLEESAVQYYRGSIFWYFHTSGDLYKTSDRITSYALLIDSDGDESTGYSFYWDFGADLMVWISGSGGQKISSNLFAFESDDTSNWSAWEAIRAVSVATLLSQAETNFTAPTSFSESEARFVSVAFDGKSGICMSVFFSLEPGVLVITQGSLIPSIGVVSNEQGQHILQLIVRGYGPLGVVESLIPSVTGASTTDLGPVIWQNEDEMLIGKALTLSIDCSAVVPGTMVIAALQKDGIETDFKSIMILGKPAIGYVGSIPSGITIDGCFSDWNDFDLDIGDIIPPSNTNIDLTKTAKSANTTDAYFFAEVFGNILKGSLMPVEESQLGPGGIGGDGVVKNRVTGEDLLQIFIDVDPFADNGAPSPVSNATLEPDFMIEIRGRNGQITNKIFFEWNNAWFEDSTIDIDAAVDNQRIEIGISKDAMGGLNGSDIAMISSDWLGSKDDYTVASVAIDPFKINLQGDVWGSLDGTSWIPKADVLNTTNSLTDLTSDTNGNLYAIFSNGTVYLSNDSANSWKRLLNGALANIVAITSDGVGQLYTISTDGMTYNATISGGSWTYRGDINFAADIIDLDWTLGTTAGTANLFAIRSSFNNKIASSTDGGMNWVQFKIKPPTNSTVSSIAAVNNSGVDLIYILERDGDIYVSNDTATTWDTTHISPGGSNDYIASPCIDLDIDSNGNLWVVRGQGEVYRLITSTWTWDTLYSTGDVSDINSISSIPIPEFDFVIIVTFGILIPLIFTYRKNRKKA